MKNRNTLRELRPFLLLWSSQAVSALGTAMTEYALIVWVYGQQGTATSVTLLTLCSFAPTILFRFIAGAAADVFTKEPVPADHPFLHLNHPERLLLTPHIGWASREARVCLVGKIAENIAKTFELS